jgi:hypothetical protein
MRIGNPRVSEQLVRAFNLTGAVSPELDELVVPTVQVANLEMGAPPAVQRTCTYYLSQGAVSGERFVFQLAVPPGVITVIKRMMVYGITATPRVLLARFAGKTSTITTPATTAGSCFTDGRLSQTGAQPSSKLFFNTQVSNVANSDWALPLYLNNPTWNSAAREFVPHWGWVVGSGNSTDSGYFEGTYDLTNTSISMTLETEEFQQD